MINSYMTKDELLQEFWCDYRNVIIPRCFKIAERKRKDLLPIQKIKGQEWLKLKNLITTKTRGNVYNSLLWVKYLNKHKILIKTSVWLSYLDSKTGSKKIILLPSEETSNAVIIFTSRFFKDWKEQLDIEESEDIEIQSRFFRDIEGKYTVYHNKENTAEIEININNLGSGIGIFEKGKYEFKRFLSEFEIKKMKEKVGNISNLSILLDEYNKKPEVKFNAEELNPNFDYFETEKQKALDEIFEKYG